MSECVCVVCVCVCVVCVCVCVVYIYIYVCVCVVFLWERGRVQMSEIASLSYFQLLEEDVNEINKERGEGKDIGKEKERMEVEIIHERERERAYL